MSSMINKARLRAEKDAITAAKRAEKAAKDADAERAERAEKAAAADAKRAEKADKFRQQEDHRLQVYAAANEAGIPRNMIKYVSSKNVSKHINEARRRYTTLKKKQDKVLQGPTTAQIIQQLKQQASELGYTNANIGRITSKMSLQNIINQAQKRRGKMTLKQEKNAHIQTIKNALAEQGYNIKNVGRITSKMSIQNILNQAAKRRGKMTLAQEKNLRKQQIIQAAEAEGLQASNLRIIGKKSLNEIIANARKRKAAKDYLMSKAEKRQEVIDKTGYSMNDLKQLICRK